MYIHHEPRETTKQSLSYHFSIYHEVENNSNFTTNQREGTSLICKSYERKWKKRKLLSFPPLHLSEASYKKKILHLLYIRIIHTHAERYTTKTFIVCFLLCCSYCCLFWFRLRLTAVVLFCVWILQKWIKEYKI